MQMLVSVPTGNIPARSQCSLFIKVNNSEIVSRVCYTHECSARFPLQIRRRSAGVRTTYACSLVQSISQYSFSLATERTCLSLSLVCARAHLCTYQCSELRTQNQKLNWIYKLRAQHITRRKKITVQTPDDQIQVAQKAIFRQRK